MAIGDNHLDPGESPFFEGIEESRPERLVVA